MALHGQQEEQLLGDRKDHHMPACVEPDVLTHYHSRSAQTKMEPSVVLDGYSPYRPASISIVLTQR